MLVLLVAVALSVFLTFSCIARPHQNIWNLKSIKVINKPFKPKNTSHVSRRRRVRRPRVLESSSSSGAGPSTSMRPNQASGPHARYSGAPSDPPSPSPSYHPWEEPEMNVSNNTPSNRGSPPPPYDSLRLRRVSTSSQSSNQTVCSNYRAESEERQMLFQDESPSEWIVFWKKYSVKWNGLKDLLGLYDKHSCKKKYTRQWYKKFGSFEIWDVVSSVRQNNWNSWIIYVKE